MALSCAGAQGEVSYDALNLPQGVALQSGKLVVLDSKRVRNGNYPVRIRVQDSTGAADEQVIVVTIKVQNGANSVSVTNNAAFGGFSGERSITLTETTRTNIRSGNAGLAGATGAAGSSGSTGFPGGAVNPTVAPAPIEIPQPDSNGVNNLLDTLQVPTSFESGSVPAGTSGTTGGALSNGNYPAFNFPTGGNADTPNYTPLQIASNQATRTPVNRNPITADDVKSRVIFDRQMNAARALGNLLSIIKQATANKNEAQD